MGADPGVWVFDSIVGAWSSPHLHPSPSAPLVAVGSRLENMCKPLTEGSAGDRERGAMPSSREKRELETFAKMENERVAATVPCARFNHTAVVFSFAGHTYENLSQAERRRGRRERRNHKHMTSAESGVGVTTAAGGKRKPVPVPEWQSCMLVFGGSIPQGAGVAVGGGGGSAGTAGGVCVGAEPPLQSSLVSTTGMKATAAAAAAPALVSGGFSNGTMHALMLQKDLPADIDELKRGMELLTAQS